jgi:hypothetical protein
MNGPGTIAQAIPDASKYQYDRIFAVPTGNPYRDFGVDDRQIAFYQVEQLHKNPLSQYTTNPKGVIPSFDCMEEPDNFSTMVNKRESEFESYFGPEKYVVDPTTQRVVNWATASKGMMTSIDVYEQFNGLKVNPNAEIVYNMSMNSKEEVNPMIAQGSSNRARSSADFSGLCYSGTGKGGAVLRGANTYKMKDEMDQGVMSINTNIVCAPDRTLSFANPLILQ